MVDRKEEELLSPESRLVVSPVGEGGRKGGAKEQVCGFSGASGGGVGKSPFRPEWWANSVIGGCGELVLSTWWDPEPV